MADLNINGVDYNDVEGIEVNGNRFYPNAVRYDVPQNLDETQKEQARKNIDASKINWCGEWKENITYSENDAVSYNGSSYIAVLSNIPDGNNPKDDTDSWQVLAEKGEIGPEGPEGKQGPAYTLTSSDKSSIVAAVKASLSALTVVGTDEAGVEHTWTIYGI